MAESGELQKPKKKGRAAFMSFLVIVLLIAITMYMNFKTVVISGESMHPTLKDKQKLLVTSAYWLVGAVRKEDIVVVKDNNPSGFMIKRVYRMAGEDVEPENSPLSHNPNQGSFRVPPGHIYVLGDNRGYSDDSRKIGPIPTEKILGKVLVSRF